MFGAHAHRDDVIHGAEEDRESAERAKVRNRRRRVSGSAWPARDTFRSLPSLALPSFSRFRDPLSKASRDIHVKGIPAAEVGTLESLLMFGVHAHRHDVIRGAKRIAKARKGESGEQTAKSIRLRVAARDTFRSLPSVALLLSRFRPFAISRLSFREHPAMFTLREYQRRKLAPWKAYPCSASMPIATT